MNSTPTHQYKNQEYSFLFELKEVKVYLTLDSNNRVYRVYYDVQNELVTTFESLSKFILDKNLDELLMDLSHQYVSEASNIEASDNLKLHYSLLVLKQALKKYRGDIVGLSNLDANQIICRCSKLDNVGLDKLFKEHKGHLSQIQKASNLSLICGSCLDLVKNKMKFLTQKHEHFEGKTFQEWRALLESSLEDFTNFSPAEFENSEIKITKCEMPQISLQIKNCRESLNHNLAMKSLMNYLSSELKVAIELEITLNSSSSNLNH